jgi:hypothetical protein
LLAAGLAAALWFAPEVAYRLDDTIYLHRLPAFGQDHRQMAIATFGYLALSALLGSVALGGVGPSAERRASQPIATQAPAAALSVAEVPTSAPTVPAFPTLPPLPTPMEVVRLPAVEPPVAVATAVVAPAPLPPTLPALRPTFTPAVARVAAGPPAAAAASPASRPAEASASPAVAAAASGPLSAPESALPAGLLAEIRGVSTSARPGERATLQARTTPGGSCELSLRYSGGRTQAGGAVTAGEDGLCAWSWTVPADAPGGSASAVVTFKLGDQRQSRQISFFVH